MASLRVGLDLTSTERSRLTGWERFALGLEAALAELPTVELDPIRTGRSQGGRWRTMAQQLRWHASGLRRLTRERQLHVVHAPTFPPGRVDAPLVWTIHDDLILGGHPEHARPGAHVWLPLARRALRHTDLCVTGTFAMAADLQGRGVSPERLRVVTPGVVPLPEHGDPPAVRSLHDRSPTTLPADFVLAVGTMEPRKQPDVALRAAAELDLPLVWAGRIDPSMKAWRPPRARALVTGVVTDPELAWLYRHAAVFLSASAYEGLDFPLLEARAAGLAVAASDIPVHREMGDEACRYFPVGDASAAAGALREAMALRPSAVAPPTWRACAEGYLAVYEEAKQGAVS